MQAKVKPGYDNSRQILKDLIPIDTPFTLFIAPSQVCNFKCHYCLHSLTPKEKKSQGFVSIKQDFEVFKKIAEQSKEFTNKYKRILLTGLGEPLTSPNIVEMVQVLNDYQITEKLEIFTNASYLTKKISDGLISAGLTKLRISIQGTSASQYKKNCGIKIDFERLVARIKYFYQQCRGKCTVYIKIIDEELESKQDKQKFFDIFGELCDEIYVENLTRAQPMMGDYDNKISTVKTFYGETSERREVCPYIFYTLQIDSEGNCFPCPPLSLPLDFNIGNINNEPLTKIWHGAKHKQLMLSHLKMEGDKPKICKSCTSYLCFTPKEDNLDDNAKLIIEQIEG